MRYVRGSNARARGLASRGRFGKRRHWSRGGRGNFRGNWHEGSHRRQTIVELVEESALGLETTSNARSSGQESDDFYRPPSTQRQFRSPSEHHRLDSSFKSKSPRQECSLVTALPSPIPSVPGNSGFGSNLSLKSNERKQTSKGFHKRGRGAFQHTRSTRGFKNAFQGQHRGSQRARVSALKRLGPKLSVRQRIGHDPTKNRNNPQKSMPDQFWKYLNLDCPICKFKGSYIKDYSKHFNGIIHQEAIRDLKEKIDIELTNFREEMRLKQEDIERKIIEQDEAQVSEFHCETCSLVFRDINQDSHFSSDFHIKIRDYLRPYCEICDLRFYAPITYHNHLASIKHLKAFCKFENDTKDEAEINNDEETDAEEEWQQGEDDEYVTLDEVGYCEENVPDKDVGDTEELTDVNVENNIEEAWETGSMKEQELEMDHQKVEEKTGDPAFEIAGDPKQVMESPMAQDKLNKEVKTEKVKREIKEGMETNPKIPIGMEHVKKVEMLFCDLCHKYLPRVRDPQTFHEHINSHCRSVSHQTAFYNREKELLMEANRIEHEDKEGNGSEASDEEDVYDLQVDIDSIDREMLSLDY